MTSASSTDHSTKTRRIIVLAHGRIVETGTHRSLIGNASEYTNLWSAYEAAHTRRAAR